MCSLNKGLKETSLGQEGSKVAVWEREHKKDGKNSFSDWKTGVYLKTYSPDYSVLHLFPFCLTFNRNLCVKEVEFYEEAKRTYFSSVGYR